MSEYNKRQYQLMLTKLNDFQENKLSLPTLISNIEGLIEALENVPNDWKNKLRQKWGILEEIYAVSLERNQQKLSLDSIKLIDNAIIDLKKMILQKIPQQQDNGVHDNGVGSQQSTK